MRVAVSGAGGRLGRAVLAALNEAPFTGPGGAAAWSRPDFDLDRADRIDRLIDEWRPDAIVHCAAWTDVDACARNPTLAMARNGAATGMVAAACASRRIDLIAISTNEVFDGRRDDGRGYGPADTPHPINAYGESKLEGERSAQSAYEPHPGAQLAIVRTSWLYGPPGNDFPSKILAAAERARSADQPLKLVSDEVGSPTFTIDLADAIVELLGNGEFAGIHHIVNTGHTSRADWARELFRQSGLSLETKDVPASSWPRDSAPPLWGVLEPSPLPSGYPMPRWEVGLAHYLPDLLRQRSAATMS